MSPKNIKARIDFIGIGAARSGTTWLAKCLEEHPQILFSAQKSKKELAFFNDPSPYFHSSNYHRGLRWYLDQFPPPQKGKIRGEFSTTYLTDRKAPQRIKKHFPKVKILVALRNPVEMLWSLFWWWQTALRLNITSPWHRELLARGLYYQHLKRYYRVFGKKNIHVVIFDDIKRCPEKVIREVYRFLGVNPNFRPSVLYQKINPSRQHRLGFLKKLIFTSLSFLEKLGLKRIVWWLRSDNLISAWLYNLYLKFNIKPGSYPPMAPQLRAKLKKFFRADIEKLEKLIGRSLKEWK